jgi:hypothetical protein
VKEVAVDEALEAALVEEALAEEEKGISFTKCKSLKTLNNLS